MTNIYIVLLRNTHLIFTEKKPKKRGNYTHDVRLFKIKGALKCEEILTWSQNDYVSKNFSEVTDWE